MPQLFHRLNEASRARSDGEFISKLGGALQEADESALWLELLREECSIESALTMPLEKESSELMAIFTTMINKTKDKAKSRNIESRNNFYFILAVFSFLL